eukprot:363655-Chlamydomonas_euryale.AAC.4
MHAYMSVPAQEPLHGLFQSWSCTEHCSQRAFILQGHTLTSPPWCVMIWTVTLNAMPFSNTNMDAATSAASSLLL